MKTLITITIAQWIIKMKKISVTFTDVIGNIESEI